MKFTVVFLAGTLLASCAVCQRHPGVCAVAGAAVIAGVAVAVRQGDSQKAACQSQGTVLVPPGRQVHCH